MASRAKAFIRLLLHPKRICGVNYYPEMEEKSKLRIFLEQCINTLKYKQLDKYYYLYGLNVKNFRNREEYVVYRPFMLRRDKLNLASKHNSSAILRNKLYFGVFAKSFGIKTPENIALIRNSDVLLLGVGRYKYRSILLQTYGRRVWRRCIQT